MPDQTGARFTLSQFRGQVVVLFFYPRAFTAGCTAEACSFRDGYGALTQAGAVVLGISADTPEMQKSFADQHRLPFRLLSDVHGHVREAYGVSSTFGLLPGRKSFVIDASGNIAHTFNSQFRPKAHVSEALKVVDALTRGRS